MTEQKIDRERRAMWRQIATDAGDDPYVNTLHPDEVIALLDQLDQAEALLDRLRRNAQAPMDRFDRLHGMGGFPEYGEDERPFPDEVLKLLDLLADAEHRATRAEAQSAIRGRAVAIYQRRAREAEAERDWNWRSSRQSKIERIKANTRADKAEAERDMLLDDLRKAEQRADQAEARVRNLEGTARVLVGEALDAETARDEHRRRADEAEAEARTQRHRADDMEDNALRAQTNLRAAEERVDEWRQAALEESAAQLPDASHIAQPPRDEKDEGVSDYTPEQRQAVTEALDGLADRLDRMADHADASDHWAWEYRYADEVREYLADWRKKYTQG